MEIIFNKLNGRNKNYRVWNDSVGSWDSIPGDLKDNKGILKAIFLARCAKTVGQCPNCNQVYRDFKIHPTKKAFRCKCQKTIVFPLVGTQLSGCQVELRFIVEILYDIFNDKSGVSSLSRMRKYDLSEGEAAITYRRLMDMMFSYQNQIKFKENSTLEFDEVYPKVTTGLGKYYKFKRGKGSERTHGVLVICEREGPSIAIAYNKWIKGEVQRLIKKRVDPKNNHIICTDDNNEYDFLTRPVWDRKVVKHKEKKYASGDWHINTAENLNHFIKGSIKYIHKGVSPEYIHLYAARIAMVHSFRGKSFIEFFNALIQSLPGLHEEACKTYKRTKDERKFRDAA